MNKLEPRAYQQKIISKAMDAIADGHKNILIASPTGSGKTVMGHLIAQNLYQKYGYKAGWTAMRRFLWNQASRENDKLIGFPHIKYFSLFDKNPPTDIDVLVEDEGHHSACDTSIWLCDTIKPKIRVALSATPFRTDQMRLCFSKTISDANTKELIRMGHLSPFHQYITRRDWTPESVADIFLANKEMWGQSIIFFLTLKECHHCADLLTADGVKCSVVHANSNQEEQISAFLNNELQVLLNVVVLTEGFDAPALKTVFARPGSRGPTMQMCGRALRKHPDKPFAQIVQNSESVWPFTRVADADKKFARSQGKWQEVRANDNADAAALSTLLATPQM